MLRHLLIIIAMVCVNLIGLIWLCRVVDPSTRYSSRVTYNYARFCSGCHGSYGEGDGRIGRFKHLEPANLTTGNFWQTHSDEQILSSIASGKDNMPAFSVYLSREDQEELLAFIKDNFRPAWVKPE
jgi:mono/diheme cytochrome c family protein